MSKVYIVSHYDEICNVFISREKAEEYVKLLSNPMNIHYDTDYFIEKYEPKDNYLNEEYYSVEVILYADRDMKKTLDCVKVSLINGADMDVYGNDGGIDFRLLTVDCCAKDTYYTFMLHDQFLKTNEVSVNEIKEHYLEVANKAFEKYVELVEQGATSKATLRVINEKLEEEGI